MTDRPSPGPLAGGGAVPAVAAAGVTGAAGLLLALTQLRVVTPPTWLLVTAVAASAVVGFLASALGALGVTSRAHRAEVAESLDFLLRTLAFTVQDLTDIDVRELGLAVYVRRPDRWRPALAHRSAPPVLAGRDHLHRLARDRAARRPNASGVVWRPGKGVVGVCVDTGAEVGADVEADTAPYADVGRAGWADVPVYVRAGLDWEEFTSLLGKYHVVLASPILDSDPAGTRVLGCLALDGPSGSYDTLWTPDVRSALADAAETVCRFVL